MTTTTLEDQLEPVAIALAEVQDKIKSFEEQETALKSRIRELTGERGSYSAGNLTVIVSANNRFDAKKALELMPEVLKPILIEMVPTVNKDKFKALAPDLFEQAQTVGELKVMLK